MKRLNWFLSAACGSGLHCHECRANRAFRESLVRAGQVETAEFECVWQMETGVVGVGIPSQTLPAKVKRLWKELRRWREAGYQLVSREEQQQRLVQCAACAHYQPEGNWGLGKCRLCGCTRAKLWLASAHCPDPAGVKW
jgi:hypothetical protein